MISVEAIADDIIAREDGYVNDPDDPGGATKFGVTIGTMTRLGLDLDGDGRVTPADVKQLSRTQARKIFVDHYFHKPGISGLPGPIQASVFDMYVNSGANAVDEVHRLNVDKRLGNIEDTLKWLVRLIIGAFLMAAIAWALRGGFAL